MSDNNIKVLVTGSANGRFKDLFAKATQIHEKYGPFDLHLCTGNFFSAQDEQENIQELLGNKIDVPIMTYFNTGETPIPDNVQEHMEATDGELCSNLYYLGKQGILSTSQGLRIAFLSGGSATYTDTDIDKLCKSSLPLGGVDFLITYEWPQDISSAVTDDTKLSVPVSKVAAALKPRYHFAASQNQFFEREPFKNVVSGFGKDEVPVDYVTRFIGLGDVLNTDKQRWFYAFNLIPLSKAPRELLNIIPENTTENPFTSLFGNKRKEPDSENSAFFWGEDAKRAKVADVPKGNYVCKICNIPGHYIKDCPQKQQKQQPNSDEYVCKICNIPGHHIRDCQQKEEYVCNICSQPGHHVRDCPERKANDGEKPKLDSCWFCLSNPKVEKHLIVSVGSEIYVTLAKGPIVSPDDSESKVPGLGHLLLVPITHYPTFGKIPMPAKIEVINEVEKYKSAIRRMFDKYDQDMVVFEVSRESFKGITHPHIQIVPIPKSRTANIEDKVRELGAQHNIQFVEQTPENPVVSFFKIELPNGKSLVHIIRPKEYFNLQFGRCITATVLGHPEREDWKSCNQTEQEERRDAILFKEAFKSFDFSLEE